MTGIWLDAYEREARLMPAVLALAPALAAALGFGVTTAGWSAGAVTLLTAVIGPAVLSKYVRERGATLERRLFESWGGLPTTQLLQPRPGQAGAVLDQRRSHVEKTTGVVLPTSADQDCRDAYLAAVLVLRSRTSDPGRFRTLHAENRSYGFERNLLGIRPEGLAMSAVSTAAIVAGMGVKIVHGAPWTFGALGIALAIALSLLAFWFSWPQEARVRRAGERYAQRLVDAAAQLQ